MITSSTSESSANSHSLSVRNFPSTFVVVCMEGGRDVWDRVYTAHEWPMSDACMVCVYACCVGKTFSPNSRAHIVGVGNFTTTNKFYPTKNKPTRTTWRPNSLVYPSVFIPTNDPPKKITDMMLTFLVLLILLLQYSNTCDAAFMSSSSPSLSLSSSQFRRPPFVSIAQERPDHHHHPYQRPHGTTIVTTTTTTTRATTASNHDDDAIIQKKNDDNDNDSSSLQLPYTAPDGTTTTKQQQRSSSSHHHHHHHHNNRETIRRTWMDQSIQYYSKVIQMRLPPEEHRSSRMTTTTILSPSNKSDTTSTTVYTPAFVGLAKQHYFALRKIKDGKPHHAEQIYRRIMKELVRDNQDDDTTVQCDHAQLAVTTLLLALHLQRTGDSKATRSVFLHFFRTIVMTTTTDSSQYRDNYMDADRHTNRTTTTPHCACSAKVLQAFALFEMKQGNTMKSFELVCQAIQFDPTLQPILNWKQFRDVQQRCRQRRRHTTTTTATTTSH
jgi:hypothetical protein